MPASRIWTSEDDQLIRTMRAANRTWDQIADRLNVSRWTAIERGRKIGAQGGQPLAFPSVERDRDPYPAGHPVTWNAITRGTCLEGSSYR